MAHVTVPNETPRRQITVTTPSTTGPFTFDFTFFDTADIKVYLGSNETALTETDDYTVTGTPGTDDGYVGGSVTLVTAVSNTTVTIALDIPIQRTTDFPTSGPFDIGALNTDLDKIFAIALQLEQLFTRALRLPETDAESTMTIPTLSDRISTYLGFDGAGALTSVALPIGTSQVSSYVGTLLMAADEATLKQLINAEAGVDFEAYDVNISRKNAEEDHTKDKRFTPQNITYNTAPTIDFTNGPIAYITATGNFTDMNTNISGIDEGGKYEIWILNNGTARTVTGWAASIVWTDTDTVPTQNSSTATNAGTKYLLEKINSVIYGSAVDFG